MTLLLPALYHWAPTTRRAGIRKRGLIPHTYTALAVRPTPPNSGHETVDLESETKLAVCLGTSPATAWALSGYWSGEHGESWDLWEVSLSPDDEVHVRPEWGPILDEIRVIGPIPKRRVWYVASRVVRDRGSNWHAG